MRAVHTGPVAVLVSLGLVLAQGVAVADPSDSGSTSSGGASGQNSGAAGRDSPSGSGSNDTGSGAAAGPGTGDPGSPPTSKFGSAPTNDTSSDTKSELADQLAKVDEEVEKVIAVRDQIDNDPSAAPEDIAWADSQAGELVNEQQIVHDTAAQQGIVTKPLKPAPPSPPPAPPPATRRPQPPPAPEPAPPALDPAQLLNLQNELLADLAATRARLEELSTALTSELRPVMQSG